MHGRPARRTVVHLGVDYDCQSHAIRRSDELPGWLDGLRSRAAELASLAPDRLVEAPVSRCPPGAEIGWHRDAPAFGSGVIGVSLGSECRMRFQRTRRGARETAVAVLAPRSGYVLDGAARWSWQHSIPPTASGRHSITFRGLRAESAGRRTRVVTIPVVMRSERRRPRRPAPARAGA